jgi:hypothetical protein
MLGTTILSAIFFLSALWGSDGYLAPGLDDTYIHLQYARQLASGHPFQYNTGDPPSSGESAFLYPFILAPAYLLGLDGQTPLIYADLLNLIAHLLAIVFLYRLTYGLAGRMVALFATVLFVLDGRLNWSYMTGMETGLYTTALIMFFWATHAFVERPAHRSGLLLMVIGGGGSAAASRRACYCCAPVPAVPHLSVENPRTFGGLSVAPSAGYGWHDPICC